MSQFPFSSKPNYSWCQKNFNVAIGSTNRVAKFNMVFLLDNFWVLCWAKKVTITTR